MYIEDTNKMENFEYVYAKCSEYVGDMIRLHFYRGIIRMDNRNGSCCVAEACVRRLKNAFERTLFSKVHIDYISDSDGCYIIITNRC